MGNTLWSSLILQATLILLLNSSHAKTKYIGTATTKNSADITEQLALDIINIIYNLRSNGTYLSKVMIKRLKVVSNMANGRVELRPTMCTQAESVLDECPLKKKLLVIQEGHMIIQYRKSERRQRPCSKFQSELSNCPFSEHPEQQKICSCFTREPLIKAEHVKRESCSFRIYTHPFRGDMISIKFNCQSV